MTSSPDDFDLDVDPMDSVEAPTRVRGPAGRPRRLVAASVLVTALLTAVLAWSLRRVTPRTAARHPVAPAVEAPPAAAAAPPIARPAAPPVPPTRTIDLPRPRRLPALLALTFSELRRGAAGDPVRLGDALGDGVAVVNLWASYCAPCLRELPAFRALAQRDRWAREVRFVPVMVDQLRPGDPAQAATLAELPTLTATSRVLLDPGDQLNSALQAAAILPGPALPVTLVFRCDELAWLHIGEVDTDRLGAVVRHLRRGRDCERPTRPPAAAPPAPPTPSAAPRGCGDGACDAAAHETCANCPDCACPPGTSCTLNASGGTHCARDQAALKD